MAFRKSTSLPVGVIGSGAAGLVTAHVLVQDGFSNVQVLTRDVSPGGVWARESVYPGLVLNNVYGEFQFSSLPMSPSSAPGGRMTGADMSDYMESFADISLKGRIRYRTLVINIRRPESVQRFEEEKEKGWLVKMKDLQSGVDSEEWFGKIVLCTGGFSKPKTPPHLTPSSASENGFTSLVLHSSEFASRLGDIRSLLDRAHSDREPTVVVVGGGKSAQDIAAHLVSQTRARVKIVFESIDAVLATKKPLPDFIRKSRFLSLFSPHIHLRTVLERFFHTTRIGAWLTRKLWGALAESSYAALDIPKSSPLRRSAPLFWTIRTNDETASPLNPTNFFTLVNKGKIDVVSPARAVRYDGASQSVVLSTGESVRADVVVLATGYGSSWAGMFDDSTAAELGISAHPPSLLDEKETHWADYLSLSDPPPSPSSSRHTEQESVPLLYRGIVPWRNIAKHDFAVNGAVFTANNGTFFETCAHWISSYLLEDTFLHLPASMDEAKDEAETRAAWMTLRYPGTLGLRWAGESISGGIVFWNWPQAMDDLLSDMGLPIFREGGSWLTWPFKVLDVRSVAGLGGERKERREGRR